jgi:hypothetical protein
MLGSIVFFAHYHNFRHQHGHLEAIRILYEHDVLPLESGHTTSSYLIQEPYLITNFHLFLSFSGGKGK